MPVGAISVETSTLRCGSSSEMAVGAVSEDTSALEAHLTKHLSEAFKESLARQLAVINGPPATEAQAPPAEPNLEPNPEAGPSAPEEQPAAEGPNSFS